MIWQSIHADDSVEKAKRAARDIFHDSRVRHYWDGRNEIGAWFKKEGSLTSELTVIWDAYYLYTDDAVWKDAPSGLVGMGHPIVDVYPDLQQIISTLP